MAASRRDAKLYIVGHEDGQLHERIYDAQLLVEGDRLVLDYVDDGERMVFEGKQSGKGHWHLVCRNPPERGTLHQMTTEHPLEGTWFSAAWGTGFWKVEPL